MTGVGYAGIIPLSASPDYREYIQAPLTSPLAAGMPYLVQFYISLADLSSIAIDRLGAYLSAGPVGPVPNYAALPFTPQLESPPNVFLTDAANWTLVSGIVIASGGEDHIVIGNFHSDANTSTVAGPGEPGGVYYYIEDVSVELVLPTERACCLPDHSCSMQFPGECELLGGIPAASAAIAHRIRAMRSQPATTTGATSSRSTGEQACIVMLQRGRACESRECREHGIHSDANLLRGTEISKRGQPRNCIVALP